MAVELPMHLKQLEPLPSALDIIRYLAKHPEGAAYPEEICDDLEISERRFSKAMRRLVTNNYMQMRGDSRYELGRKGVTSAEELAEYDAQAPSDGGAGAGKVSREMVIALPRQLVAGETSSVHIGFEPLSEGFSSPADVILRFEVLNGSLNNRDEMLKLGASAYKQTVELTPSFYDQVRFKVQVFQLSEDGEDLSDCGGLYVDVDVVPANPVQTLTAYNGSIVFKSV
jgi:hypothetical protein